MRKLSIALSLLLILSPVLSLAENLSDFEGGVEEAIVNLYPPTFEAIVNITIPAEYIAAGSSMRVSGMPAGYNSSAYPESVGMRIGDDYIWKFEKTGYGALGRQDQFSTGSRSAFLPINASGWSKQTWIRLPKNATIQSATLELTARAPLREDKTYFPGEKADDHCGSVSDAGDVNNDGYDDVLVGASWNDAGGNNAGRAYVHFGGNPMDNVSEVTMTGLGAGDMFGRRVSAAGDVNNDGYDDVIIAAGGYASIFFGGQNMDNIVDKKLGQPVGAGSFGCDVADVGDVNGDGYDDVIVGAYDTYCGTVHTGAAYLYFGGQNMDTAPDLVFYGEGNSDFFGDRVAGAGDVNADGYDDVIVSAPYNKSMGQGTGRAYIYLGGQNMDNSPDVTITGESAGDELGWGLASAGDVNGDGFDDVIIGAHGNDYGGNGAGQAYIFLGGKDMDNIADVTFTCLVAQGAFGRAVSCAGDLNLDGYSDVIIGEPGNDTGLTDRGCIHIYYGNKSMDNVVDMSFLGDYWESSFGQDVAGAGDVNKDGFDEIIAGSYWADANGASSGYACLYSLHSTLPQGLYYPKITAGQQTIWNRTGFFNGSAAVADFSKALNDYIHLNHASVTDDFGNSYLDVPITVNASNEGNFTLCNLEIVYSYDASVPTFTSVLNSYISEHKDEKDLEGNIRIPVTISSLTAGRVKIFGLNITRDSAPALVEQIKPVEIDEDTYNLKLIDLYPYFQDGADADTTLNFSVVSSTNASFVRLWISGKRYLSADAETGSENDNWTGTVEAIVACYDHWGQKTESNRFTIVVRNVNDAPLITSTPNPNTEVGVPYFYNVTAIDGDNDALHFALTKGPPGMTIDSLTGKVQWMPRDRGYFEVGVEVFDGNLTAHQNYFLTVGNIAPRITSTPPLTARTGELYMYNVTAEDANNDPLTFSLNSQIFGMGMNATSGQVTWTPTAGGSFNVSVWVSDGKLRAEQNFTIIVTQANRAPRFVSKAVTAAAVGVPYQYLAKASDDDGDALGFSLVMAPPGMEVVGSNGRVSWTPVSAGNFSVALKVSDGKGGEAIQEFTINVMERVRPRVEFITPSDGQRVSGKLTVTGVAIKGVDDITKVQLRVDSGDWTDASGTLGWQYSLDTTKLKNGPHTLQARAFDGTDYSDIVNRTITVDNQKAQGKGFIPGFPGMLAILAVVACAILLSGRRIRFH